MDYNFVCFSMANTETHYTEAAFQKEVRKIIKKKGLRHQDVAESMGISQPAITTALNGRSPGLLARIYKELTGQSANLSKAYDVEHKP